MIDVKINCSIDTQLYTSVLDIVSNTLSLNVSTNDGVYTVKDSEGVRLFEISVTVGSNNKVVLNNFSSGYYVQFSCDKTFTFETNVDSSMYYANDVGFVLFSNVVTAPLVELKDEYYIFKISDNGIDIELKKSSDTSFSEIYSIDVSNTVDTFFYHLYINNDGSVMKFETLEKVMFYFDFSNATTDLSYTYKIDDVDFSNSRAFSAVRTIINASDKLDMQFVSDFSASPYLVFTGASASSGTSFPGGTSVLSTDTLNAIKSQIDTSIADYFTNHPLDVSDVSITSVKTDTLSALGEFFTDGAYQDLSPVTSALTVLSNTLNVLKTTVDNLPTALNGTATTVDVDLSSVLTKIDDLSTQITTSCTVDLSSVTTKLDEIVTDINGLNIEQVDCSTIDLTNLQNAIIDTISANTHQFITNSSLNGSNGAIFEDGETLNVEGYTRTYTVVSSQVITTMGNQADYIYLLKDSSDRYMITVQDMLSRIPVSE